MDCALAEASSPVVVQLAVPVPELKETLEALHPVIAVVPSTNLTVPPIAAIEPTATSSAVTLGEMVAVKVREPSTLEDCDAGVRAIAEGATATASGNDALAPLGL